MVTLKRAERPEDWLRAEYPATPVLDRMGEVKDESQVIGEFLDWLGDQKTVLAEWTREENYLWDVLIPTRMPIEELLAKYYGIDLAQVEEEKAAILRLEQKY